MNVSRGWRILLPTPTLICGDRVNTLTDAQLKSEEKIAALADAQKNLTDAQLATDERLNVLITVVERHISGNNGARQ